MSSNLPMRAIRIPALQRQCLFQSRRHPRAFSTTAPQAFVATAPRLRGKTLGRQDRAMTKAAAKAQMGPAPKANMEKLQEAGMLSEDIGILQDTIVRADFSSLPAVWKHAFWSYFYKVLRSKALALYTRGLYKRCMQKKGILSYFPVDAGNNQQLKNTAKTFYVQFYENFARRNLTPISRICLPPLLRNLETRIAARGPLEMKWRLEEFHSVRVVSHRAQPIGDEQPDTAYRQAIIRLESTQQLIMSQSGRAATSSSHASTSSNMKGLKWVPKEARAKMRQPASEEKLEFTDNGKPKRVVEYLVLQKRVIAGKEEDWKIWGFTEESTPERIEEDEVYWRKTLDSQTAGI